MDSVAIGIPPRQAVELAARETVRRHAEAQCPQCVIGECPQLKWARRIVEFAEAGLL